jgi:hypothetical protein
MMICNMILLFSTGKGSFFQDAILLLWEWLSATNPSPDGEKIVTHCHLRTEAPPFPRLRIKEI